MQNRLISAISMLLSVGIVGFIGVALMRILTFAAVSGVVVALFSAQFLLYGIDLWLQERKISAAFALVPAVLGLYFAVVLFF